MAVALERSKDVVKQGKQVGLPRGQALVVRNERIHEGRVMLLLDDYSEHLVKR